MSLPPNAYLGLSEGPIDTKASSVINAIYENLTNFPLFVGDAVSIVAQPPSELLPRVDFFNNFPPLDLLFYGVCVGGDAGGVYPNIGTGGVGQINGSANAAIKKGQGVRICTQGRCLVSVDTRVNTIEIGDPLFPSPGGFLRKATSSNQLVVARALQNVPLIPSIGFSIAAVDIQREGRLS